MATPSTSGESESVAEAGHPPTAPSNRPRLAEVAQAFLKLGCTSFGGPVAHLSYLHAECVERRRWLGEAAFAELVALCQFLPGPASSQLVFALGKHRAGLWGAMLASLCFTLPSAVLMVGFGYWVSALGDPSRSGWLHGLKLAAVAVVAQAVWALGRKLCPDLARIAIALAVAGGVTLSPGATTQVGAIAAGTLAGWLRFRGEVTTSPRAEGWARQHTLAVGTLVLFAVLLLGLPLLAASTGNRTLAVFDGFYRAGSLVFGGGHVVLPLLRAEVVPTGWVTDEAFLAGYGAAQAVPGPLFTFAAYLGTVLQGGNVAWLSGLWCLLGLFLPGWLLIAGALPFWHLLRSRAWAQAGMRGANAAVVGVLLAAFYQPVCLEGITGVADTAAAVLAFIALERLRIPAWLVVAGLAAAGQWLL